MFKRTKQKWIRFLDNSSFIRHYLLKYRKWIGVGLLALITVDLLEILPPLFLKYSIDIIVEHRPSRYLLGVALGYVTVAIFQGLCRYGWRMYLIRSSVLAGRDLRKRYVHHLFSLSVSFFEQSRIGNLLSLATTDVEAVRYAMGTGLLVFADALFYLLTIPLAMFCLSPKLTVWICFPLLFIPWIIIRNETEVHERLQKVQESLSRIVSILQENIQGINVVKAFAKEDIQIQRVQELSEEYSKLNQNLIQIQSTTGPYMDFCTSLGMVILIWVGGGSLIQGGVSAVSIGTFVALQRYLQKLVWPMAALGMAFNYYQKSVSSTCRLKKVLEVPSEPPLAVNHIRTKKSRMEGKIEFRNLYFTFPGSHTPVLQNVNLTIAPGERVALVGRVGSGKSTLLSLLPKLYPVGRSMLFIDGVDINDWSAEELRSHVGYVSQDVFLFNETITENIHFGINEWMGSSESGISMEEATQLASVHDEIISFSSAYQTKLGGQGGNLSGGQRQRLTLARALIKQPAVLILDDALSSVDAQTEENILRRLRARHARNTELISAHRISTVQEADRIVVLHQGQIVEMGTHQQLVARPQGFYYKFFEQQKFKEDLEAYAFENISQNFKLGI